MLMCDHQHILMPWNVDAGKIDPEVPKGANTAAELLQQTCEGTVSGLAFMEATECVTEPLKVRFSLSMWFDHGSTHGMTAHSPESIPPHIQFVGIFPLHDAPALLCCLPTSIQCASTALSPDTEPPGSC